MTSKMVSNIGPAVLEAPKGVKADTRVSEKKDLSFQNLLSNPKPSQDQKAAPETDTLKTENRDKGMEQDNSFEAGSKRQAVKIEDGTKPKEITEDQKETAEKALSEFEEQVTEVLAEELDVTEDEIAAAMETLGLTFLDLASPEQLVQLVGELTETAEPVDLLTNESLKVVMAEVSELAANLMEEAGIPLEELAALGMTETETEKGGITMTTEELLPEGKDFSKVMEAAATAEAPTETAEAAAETETIEVPEAPERKTEARSEKPLEVPDEEKEGKPLESDYLRTGDVKPEEKETNQNGGGAMKQELSSEEEPVFTEKKEPGAMEEGAKADFHEASQSIAAPRQTEAQPIAAPENAPAPEAARPLVDPRELMEQIQEFARTNITATTSEIEMRLNPESLGRLLIHVTEQEGTVRASIQTQNIEVKEALESQLAVLRTTLEGQGMKVTEVEVTVASHEFEENLEKGNANTPGEEQGEQRSREGEAPEGRRRNLNMNDLSSLQGLMTEEEELAARIMRDNGNSVDYTA